MIRLSRLVRALLMGAALLAGTACAVTADQERDLYLNAMRLMTEGRLDEARAALQRLIEIEPQHAGAWLDLAISQCALGNAAEAERLFREIEVRFKPSAGILEVIDSHRVQGCRRWEPKQFRSISVTRGRDTNVNQGASNPVFAIGSGPDRVERLLTEEFLPQADSYSQTSFDYTRELDRSGTVALLQARVRLHDHLSEQDTNALLVGIDRPFKLGNVSARGQATASLVSLDGVLYQRQAQLQGRISPPLPLPDNYELVLSASLSRVEYLRRANFDANTGEASALLNYNSTRSRLQLGLGALYDRGHEARLGGSREGWYTSALWQRRLAPAWIGELGATRQDWHGERAYSPQIIDVTRHQSTRQLRAAVTRELSREHSLQLEYRHIENRENISLFQYNSRVLQLSWRWAGW